MLEALPLLPPVLSELVIGFWDMQGTCCGCHRGGSGLRLARGVCRDCQWLTSNCLACQKIMWLDSLEQRLYEGCRHVFCGDCRREHPDELRQTITPSSVECCPWCRADGAAVVVCADCTERIGAEGVVTCLGCVSPHHLACLQPVRDPACDACDLLGGVCYVHQRLCRGCRGQET